MQVLDQIKQQIQDNPVILFMKGSPKMPQCGFSARAAQILAACDVEFSHVDILANPEIRQTLPQYSNWPTFPQLFVNGELIGGSDIMAELYESGELEQILKNVGNKTVAN